MVRKNKHKHTKNKEKSSRTTMWLYGRHACVAALKNPKRHVHTICATTNAIKDLSLQSYDVPLKASTTEEIETCVPRDAVHQGIAIEVSPLPECDIDVIVDASLVVILDQVTDPHNVGAILRSCAAFGASGVVVAKHHSPTETGVLAKAASGAFETIPIITVTNLTQAMETLKDHEFWCIGLDGIATQTLRNIHDYEKVALVLGAEGKGLRRLTSEHCDVLVRVPINDAMESLNVSNAAAVALYELSRR